MRAHRGHRCADFTHERLALVGDTSLSDHRVDRGLDELIALRSRPAMVVSDTGTEFTSTAISALTAEDQHPLVLHGA